MNEQDFDELGKRLYDLEAEPPKDGWNKISPLVKADSALFGWLRKHWWKPLLLILPSAIYIVYPDADVPNATTTVAEVIEPVIEPSAATASSLSARDVSIAHDSSTKTSGNKNAIAITQDFEKREHVAATNISKGENAKKTKDNVTTIPSQATSTELTAARQIDLVWSAEKSKPEQSQVDKIAASEKNLTSILSTKAIETQPSRNAPVVSGNSDKKSISPTTDSTHVVVDKKENLPLADAALATANTIAKDSTSKAPEETLTKEELVKADSSLVRTVDDEKKSSDHSWRITASITPQYIMRSVRPVVTDEIWVTSINNQSKPEQIGLGFALGVGKQIAPDFFIDAQLTYASIQQDIFFSYATGNIDTLIAVLQADQSVLVTPVFEERNREITSRYGYGGLHLSGTYYFWTTPQRRFNIMASAGANYLVSARVQEKINNLWVALPTDNLNSMNYSMMVGVGYNLNLKKGWEVMINPSLTYYLREVKDKSLPYNLNQRSFGVMMMLSKTLNGNRD